MFDIEVSKVLSVFVSIFIRLIKNAALSKLASHGLTFYGDKFGLSCFAVA